MEVKQINVNNNQSQLYHPIKIDNSSYCDLEIGDGVNSIVQFRNGHIMTKDFDSSKIGVNFISNEKHYIIENILTIKNDWVKSGFTFSNNTYTSSTANAYLKSDNQYGFDRRKMSIQFKTTNASTKLLFGCEYPSSFGSAIILDFNSKQLQILSYYNGSVGSVVDYVSISSLTTNINYEIRVNIDGRNFKVQLYEYVYNTNTMKSNLVAEKEHITQIIGYNNKQSGQWGYECGSWKGKPTIILISGQITIYSYIHEIKNSKSPLLYIIGDSISEGFSVYDTDKFATLLRNIYGYDNISLSAIGGERAASTSQRIAKEMSVQKPEYTMIFLGSNSEDTTTFKNAYSQIANICNDSKLLFANVPTNTTMTNIVTELAGTYSADILDLNSLLKLNNVLNQEYYQNADYTNHQYNDNLHPNAVGNLRIAEEITKFIN